MMTPQDRMQLLSVGREATLKRINAGLSRRALARQLGVPEQTLRRFEHGEGISLRNAKILADWLGVQVIDILSGPPSQAAA